MLNALEKSSSELLIRSSTWRQFTTEQQTLIKEAAHLADAESLREVEWNNARALAILQNQHKVQLFAFPEKMLQQARTHTTIILKSLATKDPDFARTLVSYEKALALFSSWAEASSRSFLDAR